MRSRDVWTMCIAVALAVTSFSEAQTTKAFRTSAGGTVRYEEFGSDKGVNCLIVLHGASGLAASLYKDQAMYFAEHGFHVLMPHYFDVTHSASPTTEHYRAWAGVVGEFAGLCRQQKTTEKVFLVGYSLGASVALAAGSQATRVDAISEWYGSLPDDFFYELKGMPPLLILHGERDNNIPIVNGQQLVKLCQLKELSCDHHFYPDQGHGFSGKALEDADQRTLAFFATVR